MAIRQDQSLAWNSLKQLEDDFLRYRKYNVAQLQDIVSTVNGLQNRMMQLKDSLLAMTCLHCKWHIYILMFLEE